jgi:hypothetical protein
MEHEDYMHAQDQGEEHVQHHMQEEQQGDFSPVAHDDRSFSSSRSWQQDGSRMSRGREDAQWRAFCSVQGMHDLLVAKPWADPNFDAQTASPAGQPVKIQSLMLQSCCTSHGERRRADGQPTIHFFNAVDTE